LNSVVSICRTLTVTLTAFMSAKQFSP